jgi:hypothetical protein
MSRSGTTVGLHECDEAVHLRFLLREFGQDAAEPQRFFAKLRPHPIVAGIGRIATDHLLLASERAVGHRS